MRFSIFDFLGNLVNYLIFIYIFSNTVNTSCFDIRDMSIALFGLVVSVFILIVNIGKRRGFF